MIEPLSVVCFKWKKSVQSRCPSYTSAHVNRLSEMVWKNLSLPHRFFCVTDDSRGLSTEVIPVELWRDYREIPNPSGAREPSCYRRLKLFSHQAQKIFGSRVLWLDLDVMVTGSLVPLVSRKEPVVLLSTPVKNIPVNGSMVLLTPGAEAQVWDDFDPVTSPRRALQSGFFGSDQGWMGYKLPNAATWKPGPHADGIYFFHDHVRKLGAKTGLPRDARLFSFHGRVGKPWESTAQMFPWVRQHYGRPHEDQSFQA